MNISKGQSSVIGSNSFDSFKWWAEKYPNECCQRCLNKFKEKSNKLIKVLL